MAQDSISNVNSWENPPDSIAACRAELDAMLDAQPAFASTIEDADPHACSRSQLLDAMREAPTPALRQHLLSVYQYRDQLAMITPGGF